MLDWLWEALQFIFDAVVELVLALLQFCADAFVAFWTAVYERFYPYLELLGIDYLTDLAVWNTFALYWGDVAWIVPLRSMLIIVTTTLAVSATIRLTRWLIGLIPTVEG